MSLFLLYLIAIYFVFIGCFIYYKGKIAILKSNLAMRIAYRDRIESKPIDYTEILISYNLYFNSRGYVSIYPGIGN